jgi:XTP/dITP diphosphohydrolase
MKSLHFVSSNRNKYLEIQSHLQQKYGVVVEFSNQRLIEIQSDSIKEIAVEKSKSAFALISKPVIVEDDGLFIDELGGFPGQYSSFVYKTIGNNGIIKLLRTSMNRFASFKATFVFCDGKNSQTFEDEIKGKISSRITEGGWGYDPIFIPDGSDFTFGQLHIQNRKNDFSHRVKALDKFAKWYSGSQEYAPRRL